MKKALLMLWALYGMYHANAQCNAIVIAAPTQNSFDKRCINTQLTLYAYATGGTGINYTWYKYGNQITTPSLSNQHEIVSLAIADAGVYTVKISSNECPTGVTSPYTYTIQVDTAPPPLASNQSSTSMTPCVGTTNSYGVGLANPQLYDWTWNVPDGWTGSSTSSGITLTVADTSRSVAASATNGCGTRNYSFAFVTPVAGNPTALDTINLHFGQLCAGNEVYFSVNTTPGDKYMWEFAADWVQTPYPVEGITTVTVQTSGTITVKTYNSCSTDTSVYTQYITVSPMLEKPVITQVGNTLQTNAVATRYAWYDYYEVYYEYDTAIIGPTGNIFTPHGNSTYILRIVNDYGCAATSDTIQFTGAVGIGDISNSNYSMYPNPAANYLVVEMEGNNAALAITDIAGKTVMSRQITTTTTIIPVQDLISGIYMLMVETNGNKQTQKLVISK